MAETQVEKGPAQRGQYARSEATRARILQAALAEAQEVGFQNTSVTRIAARADVAVGVLNYHFGAKNDLLRELMADQVSNLVARLSPPGEQENFFAYEARLLDTYLQFLRDNPSYVRLAEEVRVHDPDLYREGTNAHIAHICGRIERGVARGDLAACAAEKVRIAAYFVLGLLTFLDRYLEDEDVQGNDAVVDVFIGLLRGGLAGAFD